MHSFSCHQSQKFMGNLIQTLYYIWKYMKSRLWNKVSILSNGHIFSCIIWRFIPFSSMHNTVGLNILSRHCLKHVNYLSVKTGVSKTKYAEFLVNLEITEKQNLWYIVLYMNKNLSRVNLHYFYFLFLLLRITSIHFPDFSILPFKERNLFIFPLTITPFKFSPSFILCF